MAPVLVCFRVVRSSVRSCVLGGAEIAAVDSAYRIVRPRFFIVRQCPLLQIQSTRVHSLTALASLSSLKFYYVLLHHLHRVHLFV